MLQVPSAAAAFDPCIGVLMTRRPITIEPSQPVAAAAALMNSCRIRHLPVVAENLVGILSLRDVVTASEDALVADVMTPKPFVITPDTALTAACERMLAEQLSALPVIDAGRLAGIFTATDALAFAVTALEAEQRDYGRTPSASELMTARPLVVADPTETLQAVWAKMRSARIRHVPVLRDDSIVGLLSDRDLLAAGRDWLHAEASPRQRAILVADAMSRRVVTVAADDPARDAAHTLLRRRVGALPVLRGRELRGMLTVSDFLYWILARA
jgi:CBS domain-containing protein